MPKLNLFLSYKRWFQQSKQHILTFLWTKSRRSLRVEVTQIIALLKHLSSSLISILIVEEDRSEGMSTYIQWPLMWQRGFMGRRRRSPPASPWPPPLPPSSATTPPLVSGSQLWPHHPRASGLASDGWVITIITQEALQGAATWQRPPMFNRIFGCFIDFNSAPGAGDRVPGW